MKAVIIGSGVAGLTAGAALANAGHEVIVFEQFDQAGGVTAGYEYEGFRWELGQLLIEGLGADEPLGQILKEIGVLDQLNVIIDDRGYVFPDFELRKPEAFTGPKWRLEALKNRFPEEAGGLERYWRDYVRFTSLMTIGRRLEKSTGLNKVSLQAKLLVKLLPFIPRLKWDAQRMMDHYFHSKELQFVFVSILADFFTPPSQFLGLGVFALNPELVYDKRMPRDLDKDAQMLYHYSVIGGMKSIVDVLVKKIKSHNGLIVLETPVKSIIIDADRATGVQLESGEEVSADAVIASGGVKETFFKLVGTNYLSTDFVDTVENLPLMDSIFMIHLGVDFNPSKHLHGPVTYFYSTYDIEDALQKAKAGYYHEGDDGFVVHVPSFFDKDAAPTGHHAMTIYTVCPDVLNDGDWSAQKEHFADALIGYAEKHIPNLSSHIKVCQILTPEDFRRRTKLDHHAFGGLAPFMNAKRIKHQTPLENLWFIGAQSESGGGVNNVMPAAYKVAHQIAQAYK